MTTDRAEKVQFDDLAGGKKARAASQLTVGDDQRRLGFPGENCEDLFVIVLAG
jgi:hypothetical protein